MMDGYYIIGGNNMIDGNIKGDYMMGCIGIEFNSF